jgi:hypothetical protein
MIDNEVEVRWSTNELKIGRRWSMSSANKMGKFRSKEEAAIYVMEKLEPAFRRSVEMTVVGAVYGIETIEEIYRAGGFVPPPEAWLMF